MEAARLREPEKGALPEEQRGVWQANGALHQNRMSLKGEGLEEIGCRVDLGRDLRPQRAEQGTKGNGREDPLRSEGGSVPQVLIRNQPVPDDDLARPAGSHRNLLHFRTEENPSAPGPDRIHQTGRDPFRSALSRPDGVLGPRVPWVPEKLPQREIRDIGREFGEREAPAGLEIGLENQFEERASVAQTKGLGRVGWKRDRASSRPEPRCELRQNQSGTQTRRQAAKQIGEPERKGNIPSSPTKMSGRWWPLAN